MRLPYNYFRPAPRHALAAVLTALAAPAMACPDAAAVEAFLAARAEGRPAAALVAVDAPMADAYCAQRMLTEARLATLGPIVGYKAGLTSAPAQAAFGFREPVLAPLHASMLLDDGAEVTVADGVRPLFEADLLVVIADAAINAATTPEQAVAHIAGVRPFMELPDLAVGPDVKLSGPVLVAGGVGASKGVAGDLVAIPADAAGVKMLGGFTARVLDGAGTELSSAPGAAVLGHPLNSVIWVARTLAAQGKALKPGDLVSVGALGPLHPMKPGAARVVYEGLPGDPSVGAVFR
jgi:2-oxo-hept-3-ene-1,7-dioate hydratase